MGDVDLRFNIWFFFVIYFSFLLLFHQFHFIFQRKKSSISFMFFIASSIDSLFIFKLIYFTSFYSSFILFYFPLLYFLVLFRFFIFSFISLFIFFIILFILLVLLIFSFVKFPISIFVFAYYFSF